MSIFAETLIKNREIMRLKSCMLMCSLFMASLASASNFASDSFKTKSGKELTITFIKHGSLMLTYDNTGRSCLRIRRLYDFPESRYHLDHPRAWRPSRPESDTSRREKRYGNHRQREQPKEAGKREGPKKRRYGYLHQLYEDRGRPRL